MTGVDITAPDWATIRPVAPADIPALAALVAALGALHDESIAPDQGALARDVLGPAPWLRVLVAESGGALVGYAALCPRAQLQFGLRGIDIHHLYVAPDARGWGLGRRLIDACLDLATTLGCGFVTVDAALENRAAQAVYEACGFERFDPEAARFRLRLPAPPKG
jgi:GNAT superfamily N-acetyltransferase